MNVQAIGDEDKVELCGLCQRRLPFVLGKIGAGIRLCIRVAPFAPAVADTMDHSAEFELACTHR